MAYKDEYEVARLYTDGNFKKQVATDVRARLAAFRIPSCAAAAGAQVDKITGEPRKMSFGPWIMTRLRPARSV